MSFVRKNALVVKTSFAAADGSATQPSAANCQLVYKTLAGNTQTEMLTLTYDLVSNSWSALWNSGNAGRGTVSWMVYGTGTLQAAAEGEFQLLANAANTI